MTHERNGVEENSKDRNLTARWKTRREYDTRHGNGNKDDRETIERDTSERREKKEKKGKERKERKGKKMKVVADGKARYDEIARKGHV